MFPIAILLAAAVAPPASPPVTGIVSAEDYPIGALNRGEEGPVAVDILVSPTGSVDDCKIAASNGFKELDAATCNLVRKRARFLPAVGPDNIPMFSVYRQVINWSIGTSKSSILEPELQLTVNQAPAGVALPVVLRLSYLTGSDGSVRNCQAADQTDPRLTPLSNLGCQVLSAQPGEIIRDHTGRPVDALNSATVQFSLKP